MNTSERKKIIERRNLHNNKMCVRCKKVHYPAYKHFTRIGTNNTSGLFKYRTICNYCIKREEEILMKWV